MNADIGDLNRRVDPFQRTGCQRIYGDNHIRLRTVNDPLNHFAGFNPGETQHARSNRANIAVSRSDLIGNQLVELAGNQRILHNERSQRIGSHIPVAEANNQYRRVAVNTDPVHKVFKFTGKNHGHLLLQSGISAAQCGNLQCNVVSDGTPNGLRTRIIGYGKTGNLDAIRLFDLFVHTGNRRFLRSLGHFLRFQRQICAYRIQLKIQFHYKFSLLLHIGDSVREKALVYTAGKVKFQSFSLAFCERSC
ncbi:hypothetical protein D3C75_650630 [compost metagenome]